MPWEVEYKPSEHTAVTERPPHQQQTLLYTVMPGCPRALSTDTPSTP
jgi:hypothetical protein